jgi:hypothetical protein
MPRTDAIIVSTEDLQLIIDAVISITYSGFVKIVDDGDHWLLRAPDDFHLATVKKSETKQQPNA